MRTDVIEPMDTTEFQAEHAIANVMMAVQDLDQLRRSNEARGVLLHERSRQDLELSRDRLSLILDDLRGMLS